MEYLTPRKLDNAGETSVEGLPDRLLNSCSAFDCATCVTSSTPARSCFVPPLKCLSKTQSSRFVDSWCGFLRSAPLTPTPFLLGLSKLVFDESDDESVKEVLPPVMCLGIKLELMHHLPCLQEPATKCGLFTYLCIHAHNTGARTQHIILHMGTPRRALMQHVCIPHYSVRRYSLRK